jgi:hypothetical protein
MCKKMIINIVCKKENMFFWRQKEPEREKKLMLSNMVEMMKMIEPCHQQIGERDLPKIKLAW